MMKNILLHISLLSLLFILLSCEKEPSGVVDTSLTVPIILGAYVSLPVLNLDTTTGDAVVRLPNGTYKISDSLVVQISDVDGMRDVSMLNTQSCCQIHLTSSLQENCNGETHHIILQKSHSSLIALMLVSTK